MPVNQNINQSTNQIKIHTFTILLLARPDMCILYILLLFFVWVQLARLELFLYKLHFYPIKSCLFFSPSSLMTRGRAGTLLIFNLSTGYMTHHLYPPLFYPLSLSLSLARSLLLLPAKFPPVYIYIPVWPLFNFPKYCCHHCFYPYFHHFYYFFSSPSLSWVYGLVPLNPRLVCHHCVVGRPI